METTSTIAPHYEDALDAGHYVRFLKTHWLVLAGGTLAGAAVLLAVAAAVPRWYRATATLSLIPPAGSAPVPLSAAAAKEVIANPPIVAETMKELGLNGDGITSHDFVEDLVDVQTVPSMNLVKVSVALKDPTKARLAATLLATKTVDLMQRSARDELTAARAALDRRREDAARNLKEAEDKLLAFQMTAEIERLQADTSTKASRRADVDAVAVGLEGERARLGVLEREFARQPPELKAPVAAPPAASPARSAMAADPANPLTNPVYTMLQYDIAQSRATIARLERQRRETLAITAGSATATQRGSLYRRRLELGRLQAEYDARLAIHNSIASQGREPAATGRPQAQLLLAAVQPDAPMPRPRRPFAVLGGILGLIGGSIAALVIDQRRLPSART